MNEINHDLPVEVVSTGNYSLKAPIRALDTIKNMRPDFEKVMKLCEKAGAGSVHVSTFEIVKPESTVHNRNFAPLFGINEDPVTGTASGSLGAYLVKHKALDHNDPIIMEQGYEIGRQGRIIVEVDPELASIRVGGVATIVMQGQMTV